MSNGDQPLGEHWSVGGIPIAQEPRPFALKFYMHVQVELITKKNAAIDQDTWQSRPAPHRSRLTGCRPGSFSTAQLPFFGLHCLHTAMGCDLGSPSKVLRDKLALGTRWGSCTVLTSVVEAWGGELSHFLTWVPSIQAFTVVQEPRCVVMWMSHLGSRVRSWEEKEPLGPLAFSLREVRCISESSLFLFISLSLSSYYSY